MKRILLNPDGGDSSGNPPQGQQTPPQGQQTPPPTQQTPPQQTPSQGQQKAAISLEEHNRLLDKVREDIKKAHFDSISQITKERDDLKKAVQDLTDKVEALEGIKAQTEKGGEVDLKALIESVTQKAGESARKGMSSELTELQKTVNALQEENRKLSLREYRAKAIEKVRNEGGDLIEPLVRGNSPEEIEQSIADARQAFAETERIIASRTAGQQQQQQQQQPNGIPSPFGSGGARPQDAPEHLRAVSQLSDQEYRAKRAEIMKEAALRVRPQ